MQGVLEDALERLTRVAGDQAEDGVAHVPQIVGLRLDLDRGAADARRSLVHEDPCVRQRPPLARGSRREQELPRAAGEAEGEGGDVVGDEPHDVADREHRRHGAAGRVDPEGDVGDGILCGEREQLRHQQRAVVVVEHAVEHEHAFVEQGAARFGAELRDGILFAHAPIVRARAEARGGICSELFCPEQSDPEQGNHWYLFGVPKNLVRRVSAVVAALGALGLTGCGTSQPDEGDGRPVVLTTFTVLADIAENVAGDHLVVESITKPGAEIHGYEPTPGDIRKATDADLILDNGLNLEVWFGQFVESVDVPHVVVSDGVDVIDIAEDTYEGKPNPHAWMSPVNVQLYADNMAEAFSELDPAHAEDFAANAETYKAQVQEVQDQLVSELSALPEKERALVTCEGAFSYLARDAGLTEAYIWAVNAEQQATPQQIAGTIEFVKKNDVPAVFCESTVSDKPMRQVVEATGAEFGGTLYVDSLSEPDGPVPTYLDLIRHDAKTIIDALTGRTP